jgi:hypothetical protein
LNTELLCQCLQLHQHLGAAHFHCRCHDSPYS